MTQKVTWESHKGPQTEALMRLEDEILYGGARGGGKTDAGLAWMVEPEYIDEPRYAGLVIRRNSDDLSDWIARARAFYRPLGARFVGGDTKVVIRFPSGAFIRTGHLMDENAYEKYQGHEYQKILIEEATQIPSEDSYLKLISSNRSTIPSLKAQAFLTTNPGGPGHIWVKQRFVDCARMKTYTDQFGRTRIFIPAKVDDNPTLINNDPQYVRLLDSLPEDTRKAWRDGDWDIFAGQYFKRLRRDVHIIRPFEIPSHWTRFRSFDWGFAHNSVCIWWAVEPAPGNRVIIYRHYVQNQTVATQTARNILGMTPSGEDIEITVAGHDLWAKIKHDSLPTYNTMADVMIGEGLNLDKAEIDRLNGWNYLRELIEWDDDTPPRLQIFSTSEAVFNGLVTLQHDPKRPEDVEKVDGDDIGDSVRYGGMWEQRMSGYEDKRTEYDKFIDSIIDEDEYYTR